MNHKELTAHIRNRIKAAGIKARVDMQVSCGSKCIRVFVPNAEAIFTDAEQKEIAMIAHCNKLTYVRGMAIDYTATTHPTQFSFYL